VKILILICLSLSSNAAPEITPRYNLAGINVGWNDSPEKKNSVHISCDSTISVMDKSIYLVGACQGLTADAGKKICEQEMDATLGIKPDEGVSFGKCID
jgi:hypothetical protein